MISVLIPCDNNDIDPLTDTLAMLVGGVVFGIISEVVLWSDNENQLLKKIADGTGCRYVDKTNFHNVLDSTKGKWVLVLKPGTRLLDQWREIIGRHIESNTQPAKFSILSANKLSFIKKLFTRYTHLDSGILALKEQLLKIAAQHHHLDASIKKLTPITLPVQILLP